MREQIEGIIRVARNARTAGRTEEARSDYGRAAELARKACEHVLLAHALRHKSELDRECCEAPAALIAASEAVALYRADPHASRVDLANALRAMALALNSLVRRREAVGIWREARELYAGACVQEGVAECDVHLSADA